MSKKCLYSLCTLLLVLLTACGAKEEPIPAPAPEAAPAPAPAPAGVSAGTISVGKAVGPDKKISTPADAFAKGDTIYVSVDTSGAGTANLKAKWTYHKDGKVALVDEKEQEISPTKPETTEFHVSNPKGWPAGDYQVEVFLDDKSIGVRNFRVA